MDGRPCNAPSHAPPMVPLAMMKPRLALSPMLMPLTTPSGFSSGGSRWSRAMLTQSLGVPSTTHVAQPRP